MYLYTPDTGKITFVMFLHSEIKVMFKCEMIIENI